MKKKTYKIPPNSELIPIVEWYHECPYRPKMIYKGKRIKRVFAERVNNKDCWVLVMEGK